MIRYVIAIASVVTTSTAALATMPALTALPAPATLQSCQAWATGQSADAFDMWGVMESGKNSKDVATLRLTLTCLGDRPPAIVGFGSSAGGDAAFCKTHRRAAICASR